MGDEKKTNENRLNEQAQSTNNGSGRDEDAAAEQSKSTEEVYLESSIYVAERIGALYDAADIPAEAMPKPHQILADFKKMSEAAGLTLQGENTASDDEVAKYSSSIAEALRGLQQGSNNSGSSIPDIDMAKIVGDLVPKTDGNGDGNVFLPFIEGMMHSLLSPEMLLPIVKDLLEKYPKYLAEYGDKISAEDKERYEKQLEMYKVVENHLEYENPDNSSKLKREKFRLVLEDMRKLQEYGQSPAEIIAETDCDTTLPNGAGAAGDSAQCPKM